MRQSLATAAFFSPKLHSVRASNLTAHPWSGMVVPKVAPHPNADPPPETDPKQVSSPAAVKPGAKAVGTFFKVVFSLIVETVAAGVAAPFTTRLEVAVPP